ncbi:SPOR domain-containing protein [Rickettsiella endosymbiont of Dermanyssus gallinae]|uniref:SPOR domain-containing protein n=1 Tax=Rickettsiella endosymbiont of Dermanyssus gallinae TaxID=2856608 RepID=UPI001C52DD7C|nr:SPOR domain-containing protein [Rickettsiella endosymbiont of Dermanyssus gallinae]
MAKDYAKYATYQKVRANRSRFWALLGLVVALFMLVLGLFFLKSHNKQQIAQQAEDKLKQKILEAPAPKPPEPKFDFYNILPQDNLTLSSQSPAVTTMAEEASVSSALKKPLDGLLSTTPEQVAIAEAKKQLEQEMSQFSNETYSLILGNFQDVSQAEQYQAQALLKGFPVQSKVVNVNGGVNYQLFMGPYTLAIASEQQKRLNTAGMQAALLKVKS